jgi:hypothetical protein
MSSMRPDPPPFRLDPVSYENLRQQILRRDGWRCQSCGAMSNLEVHDKQFRSHSGHDSEVRLLLRSLDSTGWHSIGRTHLRALATPAPGDWKYVPANQESAMVVEIKF